MSRRHALLIRFCACLFIASTPVFSASFTPFGPTGEGGVTNGQAFAVGGAGEVFELDSFLLIEGTDLNGDTLGVAARVSRDSLPPGLEISFTSRLSEDTTDVTLTYTVTNTSAAVIPGVRFYSYLDVEIAQTENTFYNEYGRRLGTAGSGDADPAPDSWEIDEPGFQHGDLTERLLLGALGNENQIPNNEKDDVAMAVGFELGALQPTESAQIEILISEDGDTLGALTLIQRDSETDHSTVIAFSGQATLGRVHYDLTISATGNGSVDVTSGSFERDTEMILTATPNPHYHLSGWTGDTANCTVLGNNQLLVPVTGPRTITAEFAIDTHTLDIVSLHGGADPAVGTHSYAWNTAVACTLNNSPVVNGNTRYVCTGWTGAGSVSTNGRHRRQRGHNRRLARCRFCGRGPGNPGRRLSFLRLDRGCPGRQRTG